MRRPNLKRGREYKYCKAIETGAYNFYLSKEWIKLRYEVLREQGKKCNCCGVTEGVTFHVDHILPISKYPHRKLDKDNLQVLCDYCNKGKSNMYTDDWRPSRC